jgi:hypothetical protein
MAVWALGRGNEVDNGHRDLSILERVEPSRVGQRGQNEAGNADAVCLDAIEVPGDEVGGANELQGREIPAIGLGNKGGPHGEGGCAGCNHALRGEGVAVGPSRHVVQDAIGREQLPHGHDAKLEEVHQNRPAVGPPSQHAVEVVRKALVQQNRPEALQILLRRLLALKRVLALSNVTLRWPVQRGGLELGADIERRPIDGILQRVRVLADGPWDRRRVQLPVGKDVVRERREVHRVAPRVGVVVGREWHRERVLAQHLGDAVSPVDDLGWAAPHNAHGGEGCVQVEDMVTGSGRQSLPCPGLQCAP